MLDGRVFGVGPGQEGLARLNKRVKHRARCLTLKALSTMKTYVSLRDLPVRAITPRIEE